MNNSFFTRKHTNTAKGIAIILMLFYHLFWEEYVLIEEQVIYSPISKNVFLTMSGFGNICVAIFVVLSGYGIANGLFTQWRVSSANLSTINSSESNISAANSFVPNLKTAYSQAAKRFLILMCNFLILYISIIAIWFYKFDLSSLYGSGKQGFVLLLSDATGLSHFFGTPTLCDTWWYMKLAYILILLIPLLSLWASKTGYGGLLLVAILPFTLDLGLELNRYLICAAIGVYAAYGDWFGRLINRRGLLVIKKSSGKISALTYILNWIILLGGLVLSVLVRSNAVVNDYFLPIVNAAIALFIIWGSSFVLAQIKPLGFILELLGKYSMYIYLIHPFFYMILWRKYIYAPKYAGLILLLLLAVSFAYSFILEMIKKGIKKIYQLLKSRKHNNS